jgi:general secretion pathway protein B
VPALQDLPAAFRESAPKLRLEVLLYSDAPAERMVFINGRKYKEGDTVEGNAVVESIVRDGAVISYQGQRFLLRE